MTRIIGGSARGRRLRTPSGDRTRPTSDRVREALFSAWESWAGTLSGLRVLDLYAGSGAVGLEAWSRGAAAVRLVEADRRTAALIEANLAELGCAVAEVTRGRVRSVLMGRPEQPFDIVFADPPYDRPDAEVVADLEALAAHGWLAEGALVVVERSVRSAPVAWPVGFEPQRDRRYGETALWSALWYGRADDPAEGPDPSVRSEE